MEPPPADPLELGRATGRRPPFKYSALTRVWFSDTDAQGIVYYGRYLPTSTMPGSSTTATSASPCARRAPSSSCGRRTSSTTPRHVSTT